MKAIKFIIAYLLFVTVRQAQSENIFWKEVFGKQIQQ